MLSVLFRNSHLLSPLLLLLTLVALMAQFVSHFLTEFCLLLQPVRHCVSLILKLHLFL